MFRILVHRGLKTYKENSRLALQKALEEGFGIEIDIHRTKDKVLVVTHDKSLARLYGHEVLIPNITLDKVKEISDEKEHTIMTLTETLELIKDHANDNALMAIQIKDPTQEKIAELAVKTIEEFDRKNPDFNIYGHVFVFDATKKSAEQLKEIQPKLKVGMSVGEDNLFTKEEYRKKYPTIYPLAEIEAFPYFDIVWADEWQNGLYTESFIRKIHNLGKKAYAISPELHKDTVPNHPDGDNLENIKKGWRNLIRWGVDGICTDFPEELKEVLKNEQD